MADAAVSPSTRYIADALLFTGEFIGDAGDEPAFVSDRRRNRILLSQAP